MRILEDLSSSAPDKLWLVDFSDINAQATITGMALDNQTIATFMRNLQGSKYFYEVDLVETSQSEPIRSILVPTDLSELAEGVLEPAIGLAKFFEARLVFLHVIDPEKARKDENGDKSHAKSYLKDLSRKAESEGVQTTEIVDQGDVAKAILDGARFHGCGLIAMTTHGRSGISRLILGSVAEEVLREGAVPLLVIRARQKAGSAPAPATRRMK